MCARIVHVIQRADAPLFEYGDYSSMDFDGVMLKLDEEENGDYFTEKTLQVKVRMTYYSTCTIIVPNYIVFACFKLMKPLKIVLLAPILYFLLY